MPVRIPLTALSKHCNPFGRPIWGKAVSRKDVQDALRTRRLAPKPGGPDHAARIAFLVENPARDPLIIDVGVPALRCFPGWLVQDGNHRLAAALFRGDEFIEADVSGELAYAAHLFGVDCADPA